MRADLRCRPEFVDGMCSGLGSACGGEGLGNAFGARTAGRSLLHGGREANGAQLARRQGDARPTNFDAARDFELVPSERNGTDRDAGGQRLLRDAHSGVADHQLGVRQQLGVGGESLDAAVRWALIRPRIACRHGGNDKSISAISKGGERGSDQTPIVLEF